MKEYWIVDPTSHSVEILTLEDQRFIVHSLATVTGNAESESARCVFPHLTWQRCF